MGAFEDLNIAGLRALGLGSEWVDIADYDTPPTSAAAGAYMEGSPKALACVAVRETVHARTARAVIGTAALTGTTYTITIDANAVAFDSTAEAPADADELVQGIVDGINADVTVGAIVTASVDPDDEDGLTIKLVGLEEEDYSFAASVAGGTGTFASQTADPVSCDVRLWVTPGGTIKSGSVGNENGWIWPLDAVYEDIDYRGFMERFDVASCDRASLQVENIAKHASDGASVTVDVWAVMIGPCVATSTG